MAKSNIAFSKFKHAARARASFLFIFFHEVDVNERLRKKKEEKRNKREKGNKIKHSSRYRVVKKIMYVIHKMCSWHGRDKRIHFSLRRCTERREFPSRGAICRRNDSSTEREILADYRRRRSITGGYASMINHLRS